MSDNRPTKFDADENVSVPINATAAAVLMRALKAYRQELTARIYNQRIAGNHRPHGLEEEESEIGDMIEYVEHWCSDVLDTEDESQDPV